MRFLASPRVIKSSYERGMLSKLFPFKTRAIKEPPPLADGVQQSILGYLGMRSIAIMPRAAQQAFEIATNPNSEAEEYVTLVERDEGLSARVLKIANSVYYNRGSGSKTIAEAINVIGITELSGLLNASALSHFFPSRHPLRVTLWKHNIGVAVAARVLARSANPSAPEQAFLAGLMHDIGKLLMVQQQPTMYERVVKRAHAEGLESATAETEEFPFDHTQVGHLIAERWKFSADLITVISSHHRPWSDIAPRSVTAVVKAADSVAHVLGLGAGVDTSALRRVHEPLLSDAWRSLEIPPSEQETVLRSITRTFDEEHSMYESWGSPS
jgi:putative nucleotidyltransferase with HDIG domain